MYKNFFIPLQIFLILEKININFFYSKASSMKTFYFFINKNYLHCASILLKLEFFTTKTSLVEGSIVDLKKYNLNNFFFNYKKFLLYYIFFIYNNNIHFIALSLINISYQKLFSLDKIYPNANWVERELSEMYGFFFFNKKDSRKLLLDYSKKEYPLLKDFPCEGYSDIYYNFFDFQINYIQNEVVEL